MKTSARFALAVAVLLLLVPMARSQEVATDQVPLQLGDFTLSGSSTAGFRFDSVKGYEPKFRELFGLTGGFRLLDLNVNGEAQEGKNPFADHFFLQMSSLGGDPYPTAQFAISKHNVYDFRASWQQSYYFWNQNDNVVLPIAALAPAALGKGLTNNHDWSTVRKFGSVDFTLHATNALRFRFNYYRPSDEGTTFTTRSPDFFNSPSFWGTYARGTPYYLNAPISDYTNRFAGGVDYSLRNWSFHYNIGYQTFTENSSLNNVVSPEHSINPVQTLANPAANTIVNFSSTYSRRLTTPISEFSFIGKPLAKLEWRGGYNYYHYQGPMSFNQAFNGTAPNATNVQTAYTVSQQGRAMVASPNQVFWQGLSYNLYHWLRFDADYKYSRVTSTSTATFASVLNTTPSAGNTTIKWMNGLSAFTFSMDITPIKNLVIRPGVLLSKWDVESVQDGVINANTTKSTKTVSPAISFGYEPTKKVAVRGDFHTVDNGTSYTAITPHTEQGARFMVRYQPIEKLSVEDSFVFSNSQFLTTQFKNNIRSNAITVSYSMGERLSVFAGFSYDSYYAQGDINYVRGTAPLNNLLRDQEVNRVISGGFEAKPTKHSGIRFSGNFDRSTGVGAISGLPPATTPLTYNEPPAYGIMTWPLATATGYYNLPMAGTVAVDLQRTYYTEQIVKANNFSANLLTIRWTKGF